MKKNKDQNQHKNKLKSNFRDETDKETQLVKG
jgi:hypothetical protein